MTGFGIDFETCAYLSAPSAAETARKPLRHPRSPLHTHLPPGWMPFQPSFWADGFGMVDDRFGTHWIVNGGMKPME